MGKKKSKKGDGEKKAALVAKKEAKQEKAAMKRLTKEHRSETGGRDHNEEGEGGGGDAILMNDHEYLDRVLQSYKKQSSSGRTAANRAGPTWEPIDTIFPLARANATLEYCTDDSKKKKSKGGDFFYLFGGEYFDGIENIVLDGLLRFDVTKQEWKVLVTPPGRPQPSPRCAHSCVSYKNHLYIFGGEMSNGDHYHHFRDLWKFNVSTLEWTEIVARDPPSPRSGHATVVWKSYMIVFGGFYEALKSDTKWYNDVHILHLQSETWLTSPNHATPLPPMSRLSLKPEPRSACNIALFGTDQVMIHGGFSKYKYTGPNTLTSVTGELEVKVHSDAWVLNLAHIVQNKAPTWERWISSSTKSQLAKEHQQQQGAGTGTGTSAAVGPRTPNGRAGTSSVSYKGNRMLVFGGVVDSEHHHHKVESVFYSDLMALDMERRKWSMLRINSKLNNNKNNNITNPSSSSMEQEGDDHHPRRKAKDETKEDRNQQQGKGEKDDNNDKDEDVDEENDDDDEGSATSAASDDDVLEDEDDENADQDMDPNKKDGWDLEDLRANMFAFMDAHGNIVYEKVTEEDGKVEEKQDEEDEDEEEEEEKEEEKEESDDDEEDEEKEEEKQDKRHTTHMKTITSSSVMKLNAETHTPEAVVRTEPLPRINSCLLLRGHILYLLGGILEVGDREVTLDDMWSLDLRKRDQWECLWPGTMHKQVWRGAIHDDDDSYISTGNKEGSDDDDDDDDSDGGGSEDDNNNEEEGGKDKTKKKKKKSSKKSSEIAGLHEAYGLGDEQRVPKSSESLADFYARTSAHWNSEAARKVEGTGKELLSTKELKREGFQLARERYEELRPILDRLGDLDLRQHETPTKKDRLESSGDKKEKKSKKSTK